MDKTISHSAKLIPKCKTCIDGDKTTRIGRDYTRALMAIQISKVVHANTTSVVQQTEATELFNE